MSTFNFILPEIRLLRPENTFCMLADFYKKYAPTMEYPAAIAAFDITQLNKMNQNEGAIIGDQALILLSEIIEMSIEDKMYLVQGLDAKLLAIVPHKSVSDLTKAAQKIQQEFGQVVYGLGEAHSNFSINMAIEEAIESSRIQQILNPKSKKHEPLFALLSMMKTTDADLERHVKRTQELSVKLAEKIGLPFLEKSQLQLVCVLHDIGKLFVPQDILQKNGALTKDEMAQIKQHAQKGADFLLKMPSFENIALFVKYHHERYDGKGYPEGIAGHTIPLLSRIVSLVDSYDAMANDRVYRKALPEREIVNELLDNIGTQFDPHLASLLITMIESGELTPGKEKGLCSC